MRWTRIRRVSLECENTADCRLQFGTEAPTFTPLNGTHTIISRGISTVPLTLNFPIASTTDSADATTTETSITTIGSSQTNTANGDIDVVTTSPEGAISAYVKRTPNLCNINNLVCIDHFIPCKFVILHA